MVIQRESRLIMFKNVKKPNIFHFGSEEAEVSTISEGLRHYDGSQFHSLR
jgi:hypothetical protein